MSSGPVYNSLGHQARCAQHATLHATPVPALRPCSSEAGAKWVTDPWPPTPKEARTLLESGHTWLHSFKNSCICAAECCKPHTKTEHDDSSCLRQTAAVAGCDAAMLQMV